MDGQFANRLAEAQDQVGRMLGRLLDADPAASDKRPHPHLSAAMRHAVLAGGKRLRPFVLIESARLFSRTGDGIIRAAAALECVHCYSLVHDDLPAMDDDDLRRGQPTVHRAFDEATAILAGDALLTLAFAILADAATDDDPAVRLALIAALGEAAGLAGMVGGQMFDLDPASIRSDENAIADMQAMKTGALFRFAAEAGAIVGRASPGERARLARFGAALGRAFQLADDLIDATAAADTAGKATSKDAGRGKATLVALRGVRGARLMLDEVLGEATRILEPFGERAALLAETARYIAAREG
jgi:farnesyl diphosphate synthase